jgi:hypothetical protein
MSFLEYLGVAPTLPGFAARLIRALPEDERELWRFDADRNSLKRRDGDMEINLQNMFLEYRSGGVFSRRDLVRKYVDLAVTRSREVPALWIAAMKNVIPVARSEFAEVTLEIKRRAKGEHHESLALPLAGDLRIRLVYDFGNFVTYIQPEQLQTWGKTPSEVLEQALANLGRLERPTWIDSGRGFQQLSSPESYGESMFQLPSVVAALPFAADAVLMPCNRGILLAADGKSETAMRAMLEEALRCLHQEPWPMSAARLAWNGEAWHSIAAPESLSAQAHDTEVLNSAQNYEAQREALDELHASTGRDVYTAAFGIIKRNEHLESYCTWTKGVETMLPVTDCVAFVRELEGEDFLMVPWHDALEICASHLQATAEQPTRWLVASFPDDAEWRALSERALK